MYEPVAAKTLPDGREITIDPMTYGKFRLHISSSPGVTYDDGW